MTSSGQVSPDSQPAPHGDEGAAAGERALVAAAQKDAAAFGALYERYFANIYSYVYYRVGTHERAEDIVGDVFERALRGVQGFRWRSGGFRAWLFRIARNALTDHYRKQGRRPRSEPYDDLMQYDDELRPTPAAPEPDASLLAAERRREILAHVARLTEAQQEAVILKYLEGMSNQEIAQVTGRSATAVSSLLHRALQELQERLVDGRG